MSATAALELHSALARGLDEDGYVVLDGMMDEPWRAALAARFDAVVAEEDARAGAEVGHCERDVRGIADLVNKGEVFDGVWQHPLVLAAAWHVLRRAFRLSSLNGREPLLGAGHQALHADYGPRPAGSPFAVVNSLWSLDGFDGANGSTRLVPGTHLLPGSPSDHCRDLAAPHPDEVVLRCPPGAVVVFNAHLWHGGTVNRNGRRRRLINAYYTADRAPQTDQRARLRPGTAARLSPAARAILDA